MSGQPPTWQSICTAYAPLLTGNLSAIGSIVIIYSMIGPGRWRTKLKKPQNRLLLAMSIYDLFHSLPMAWTFLLYPKEYGVPGAQGNMLTCRMLGFLIEIGGNGTGAYNALLSIYYWLSICRGVNPSTFAKYEPFAHVIIFLIFCGFAITGVAIKLFNPGIGGCFIGSYPLGCESGPDAPPCERFPPQTMSLLFELFAQMWVQAYIVIVTVTHIFIWRNVREQDKVIRRYSGIQIQSSAAKRLGRSQSVAVQSTLYVMAFISCWIGPTIYHLIGWIWGFQSFWALFVISIFTPLQGFWNAVVYARPTYLRLRKKDPELGRFQAARIVFFDPDSVKRNAIIHNKRIVKKEAKSETGSNTITGNPCTRDIDEAHIKGNANDDFFENIERGLEAETQLN